MTIPSVMSRTRASSSRPAVSGSDRDDHLVSLTPPLGTIDDRPARRQMWSRLDQAALLRQVQQVLGRYQPKGRMGLPQERLDRVA